MPKPKLNKSEVSCIIESYGYKLCSDYINYHSKLTVIDEFGYLYYSDLNHIKRGKRIQKFGVHSPYTIYNIKLWTKLNGKSFMLLSDKYVTPHENLLWKCLKDSCCEIFEMPWSRASSGGGCGFCHGKQVGESNCLANTRPDLAKEWHPTKNGNLTPHDITSGSRKDIWWLCLDCGNEWCVKPNSRTSFDTGCPECNKSKGEKRISEYLDLMSIDYIPQKEYEGLIGVGNGQLSYDFYLPNKNLLIEFQGEQHEHYCKGFHKSKNDFKIQQEHDKRKREHAQTHNINLLEIWYWDFDNIEDILKDKLSLK